MLSHFFIDRPIFATVISLVIVIVGLVAFSQLPVAQYPEVAPPTISVTTIYPGANAQVVATTVATPIEQEVNGVEKMLYMSSRSTNDGQLTLDVTFELGTNLDMAQVLVQNRVKIAEAKLPEEVKRQGVTVKKKSPSILLCVNLVSPGGTFDQLYLSNYATLFVKDALARIPGVGDVSFLGPRDYSMRVWLDPEELSSRSLAVNDVLNALQEQNVQVAAGRIGQPPVPTGQSFQLALNAQGRLTEAEEFGGIVIKTGNEGEVVFLRDVARLELGAKNYDVSTYLDGQPCLTLAIFQQPGSNALATAEAVRQQMAAFKLPRDLEFRIVYDTTVFIDESVHDVYKTLFEAFILVFLVVLVFLQDWKATILPMIDVPVSLIGTLAVMALLGFSLNNLTLFGLVLAIGIVVDDAIVVLENVETWLAKGMSARDATRKAMEEITGPIIAITLVLCAVFIPTVFLAGISGQFYRQFALTIAAATVISAINAMTMTPSRCAQIFKTEGPHGHHQKEALPRWGIALICGGLALWLLAPALQRVIGQATGSPGVWRNPWTWVLLAAAVLGGWFVARIVQMGLGFALEKFNRAFDLLAAGYGKSISAILRMAVLVLLVYGGLMGLTGWGFTQVPVGFIPDQDKGYLIVNAQLPDGASLERTEALMAKVDEIVSSTDGVVHTIRLPGYSILNSANLSNMGGMFVILDSFEERGHNPALHANSILRALRGKFAGVQEAVVVAFGAPPIDGLGNASGFKLQLQDLTDSGPAALQAAVEGVSGSAAAQPGMIGIYSSYSATQPQLFIDIDREKAKTHHVAMGDIFSTLQTCLGSAYVNDFTRNGRNWQVNVQADAPFRRRQEDIGRLEVRNGHGEMVPLGTLIEIREISGPAVVNHYNLYPSAEVSGGTLPGFSSGDAIGLMDKIAVQELSPGMSSEWTELTLLQILAGQDVLSKLVFPLAVVFVFMVLAAQYESWTVPISIIMIVPMCLSAAIAGVWLAGLENNIFTQIGLVVLVALASKNAILIVEFARQRERAGLPRHEALVEACRLRLRPILMTSLAFILGVVPLVRAHGAGAEMRRALGVAVFSGMLGVTLFGLIFTPAFYYCVMWMAERWPGSRKTDSAQK
ncbi:MAG: efflux RND transporter permease subunit [Pirellulales bacterium]